MGISSKQINNATKPETKASTIRSFDDNATDSLHINVFDSGGTFSSSFLTTILSSRTNAANADSVRIQSACCIYTPGILLSTEVRMTPSPLLRSVLLITAIDAALFWRVAVVGGHYGLERRGVFIDLTKTVQYARIQIGLRKK
jgi:hypothetical protein